MVGNSLFWSKLTKMSILDNILKKDIDYSQIFRKMSMWVKICKYLDFGQNCRKISFFMKIYENLDFGQNL